MPTARRVLFPQRLDFFLQKSVQVSAVFPIHCYECRVLLYDFHLAGLVNVARPRLSAASPKPRPCAVNIQKSKSVGKTFSYSFEWCVFFPLDRGLLDGANHGLHRHGVHRVVHPSEACRRLDVAVLQFHDSAKHVSLGSLLKILVIVHGMVFFGSAGNITLSSSQPPE